MRAVPLCNGDGETRRVFTPDGRRVPKVGIAVSVSPYWVRRAQAGDIELREIPSRVLEAEQTAVADGNRGAENGETEASIDETSDELEADKKPRRRGARGDA